MLSREPWLAVNLSMLLPGVGQVYSGQPLKGILFTLIFIGLLGRGIWSIFAASGNTIAGFWQLGLAAGLYVGCLWDAYHSLQPAPPPRFQTSSQLRAVKKPTDPWYGLFLSQILPGLGQFYLGQPVIGGLFLLFGVGMAYGANNYFPILMPLAYGLWAIAGYHAYRIAPHRQTYAPAMVALIVAGLMFTRLLMGFTPLWINRTVVQCIVPSESMLPTLAVNDRIFVSRDRIYRPQSGDIVVFQVPASAIAVLKAKPDTLFVKRIIGLPGQQVQIKAGQIWIDQIPLQETYSTYPASYAWGPEIVPRQAYFVLGDNRDASADSHVWGFLPAGDLIGKAYKIYWPPAHIQSLG